jgi:hypothetical protein
LDLQLAANPENIIYPSPFDIATSLNDKKDKLKIVIFFILNLKKFI